MLIELLILMRRILITKWIGEVWERYTTNPIYKDTIFKCFQRTGCLLTADGSDDNEVRPLQGMTDYVLPAVSQDWVIQNIIDNIVDEIAQDSFKLYIELCSWLFLMLRIVVRMNSFLMMMTTTMS